MSVSSSSSRRRRRGSRSSTITALLTTITTITTTITISVIVIEYTSYALITPVCLVAPSQMNNNTRSSIIAPTTTIETTHRTTTTTKERYVLGPAPFRMFRSSCMLLHIQWRPMPRKPCVPPGCLWRLGFDGFVMETVTLPCQKCMDVLGSQGWVSYGRLLVVGTLLYAV
eukprot:2190468-Pyramimonas_sp.AAC.1